MTTYKIKNMIPDMDKNEMLVFYEFSNGEMFSNRFTLSTTIAKIKQWGQNKCTWFDEREVMVEEVQKQLALEEAQRLSEEQQVVDVVEEIIEQ
jgi:hypothetical protein